VISEEISKIGFSIFSNVSHIWRFAVLSDTITFFEEEELVNMYWYTVQF
jgi:hypothetical protein